VKRLRAGGAGSCAVRTAAGGVLLAALGAAAPPHAAETLQDRFNQDWYFTEVVVFQRPGVQDHAAEERLARPPAPLPQALQSFRLPPAQRWSVYRLDPATRAFLTFPYLDHSRLHIPDQDEEGLQESTVESQAQQVQLERQALEQQTAETATPGMEPPGIEPHLAADPLLDFLHQLAAYETTLEQDSYRWLAPDTFTLTSEARRLAGRGGHQVILHGRWLQPVPPREAPQPLLVQTGPRYHDTYALEGSLQVTLGRYLHFRAELFYTEPLLGRAPMDRVLAPPQAMLTALADTSEPSLSAQDLAATGFIQLRESRRMRSGELHYLDHPKLAVLVRIEPVTPPESLSAAYAALEKTGLDP
jgi:hypothetical protein